MAKPFLTVEQQVALLQRRGMEVREEEAIPILLRDNYYSIINGYKDPFLDNKAMQASADIYLPGTTFSSLYTLFLFDRNLRQIVFRYLIQAESALKTATVYSFCFHHRGCSDYLDRQSFVDARNMLVSKHFRGNVTRLHAQNLSQLITLLNEKQTMTKRTRPFTAHYLKKYGEVPLWVLANDLTFGNMSHFYQLMTRRDQNLVCQTLYKSTSRPAGSAHITPHQVLRAYKVLVFFRNLCAHDERLYCAKEDGMTFATIWEVIGTALSTDEMERFRNEIVSLVAEYENRLKGISKDEMMNLLGITE